MNINLNIKDDLDKLRKAKVQEELLITGKFIVARDAAHKKIQEIITSGNNLELSLKDSIIYYMGPTPTRDGYPIGSCGPTSSYRMDDLLELTLKLGVIATIGKGERKNFVTELIKKYKAPYLITIGGAGAYLATCVKSAKVVLFEELSAEAVLELYVANFPVIVGIDIYGNSIFTE